MSNENGDCAFAPEEILDRIKTEARSLGFSLTGVAPAARPDTLEFLHNWLTKGHHGEMGYIPRRRDAYAHPQFVLPEVRNLILFSMNYTNEATPETLVGRVAKYASGTSDYHDLIRSRLKEMIKFIRKLAPESRSRVIVDTAPVLERDFARRAGLGWFGKNTMLINKREGSYFFLAGILTDLDLPADAPHLASHCGTCTRCLDACPTDAFDAPYILDARKCIAYLTIELRDEPIPLELRAGMQDWIFGCDICQDVCPWNRKSTGTAEPAFSPQFKEVLHAASFLMLSADEFQNRFAGTPLERTGRDALARNAAIALGNSGDKKWIPFLEQRLTDRPQLVQEACLWALEQIRNPQTREL